MTVTDEAVTTESPDADGLTREGLTPEGEILEYLMRNWPDRFTREDLTHWCRRLVRHPLATVREALVAWKNSAKGHMRPSLDEIERLVRELIPPPPPAPPGPPRPGRQELERRRATMLEFEISRQQQHEDELIDQLDDADLARLSGEVIASLPEPIRPLYERLNPRRCRSIKHEIARRLMV
jgi:hypothetical protein